jgi:hypothetical protein
LPITGETGDEPREELRSVAHCFACALFLEELVPECACAWRFCPIGKNPVNDLEISGISERLYTRVSAKFALVQIGTAESEAKLHEPVTLGWDLGSQSVDHPKPPVVVGDKHREGLLGDRRVKDTELTNGILSVLLSIHSLPFAFLFCTNLCLQLLPRHWLSLPIKRNREHQPDCSRQKAHHGLLPESRHGDAPEKGASTSALLSLVSSDPKVRSDGFLSRHQNSKSSLF